MENVIYTVSQLNREVKTLLEGSFLHLWIEGEISNFVAPHSGHWYFSLKDAQAQIRCAMFKPHQRLIKCQPKDGMQVLLKARVSLYEGRGDFQLIVEHLEEAGIGQLQRAFEELKKRLAALGLFDAIHKKPMPALPKKIGVITSPTGAAIRDILNVLKRRFANADVVIYPTLVQGELAAPAIVNALQTANSRKECDVLILARGGGSLEDLWPFNEETVAHAIHQSQIPIITGVGHEIDFTIADFVADLRAPTPSAAAELITPDAQELSSMLSHHAARFSQLIKQKLVFFKQSIAWMRKHLQHQHPKRKLLEREQQLDLCELKLTSLITQRLQQEQTRLAEAAAKLDALSPLSTLKRGFAIATTDSGKILLNKNTVTLGDRIQVRLHEGSLQCVVEEV